MAALLGHFNITSSNTRAARDEQCFATTLLKQIKSRPIVALSFVSSTVHAVLTDAGVLSQVPFRPGHHGNTAHVTLPVSLQQNENKPAPQLLQGRFFSHTTILFLSLRDGLISRLAARRVHYEDLQAPTQQHTIQTNAMETDGLVVDSWRHKTAIFVFNALVIVESALMMSLSTNPFFGTMTQPTPAFIAFMLLQIAFLGGSLLLGCGTCVSKIRFVQANRVLFVVNALNYAVYAVVFFAFERDNEHGCLALLAVLVATLGALLCRDYEAILVINVMGEKLPTESPSFVHHKLQINE